MVNKCSVVGCFVNYSGYEKGTVFPLPEEEHQRQQWIKFLHRSNIDSLKHVYICYKHFSEDVLSRTPKRIKLLHHLKPVPTVIPKSQKIVNLPPAAVFETLKTPRKPPKERIFREDEMRKFKKKDEINSIDDITEGKVQKELGRDFKISRLGSHVSVYFFDNNVEAVPQVTYCVKIEETLTVKLFHKGIPIPLPVWFTVGKKARLTSWSMLENFIAHMKQKL